VMLKEWTVMVAEDDSDTVAFVERWGEGDKRQLIYIWVKISVGIGSIGDALKAEIVAVPIVCFGSNCGYTDR